MYSDKTDQATPAGTLWLRPRAATVMIRKWCGGEVGYIIRCHKMGYLATIERSMM
jgi:hypothetical protein